MTTRCTSVIVAMMFIMISGSISMAAEVCTKDRETGASSAYGSTRTLAR